VAPRGVGQRADVLVFVCANRLGRQPISGCAPRVMPISDPSMVARRYTKHPPTPRKTIQFKQV
jgi:hypothetical protein